MAEPRVKYPDPIGECSVQGVYLEYDSQPVLFWVENHKGHRFIVVLIDVDGDHIVYRFAPILEERLADLDAGRVDVHSVFRHCEAGHGFDVRWQWKQEEWVVVGFTEVRCEDMTPETLPTPGHFMVGEVSDG